MVKLKTEKTPMVQICLTGYTATEKTALLSIPTAREVLRDDGVKVILVSDLFREETKNALGFTE